MDDIWHWTFYNQDANGNVTHLTDATGAVVEKYQYDAFGRPLIYNGAGAQITESFYYNRFLFTGREYESSFGIYHYRARAYHPRLGRFMSEDPKLFVHDVHAEKAAEDWSFEKNPSDAELNLFRYCGNDPLDFTDPMGLFPERDFIAGLGDTVTFGQAEKVADFFYPGYAASVDKTSLAFRAGSLGGLAAGLLNGKSEIAGLKNAPALANKLNHIFGKAEHNLANVVKQFGSEEKAYRAIEQATQATVKSQGLKGVFETTVKVGSDTVTVRGNVIDGTAKIGTAFKRVDFAAPDPR